MNVNSRLIRWAYWLDRKCDGGTPSAVSLCALFWRTVLLTPLALAVVALSSPLWVPIWALARFVFAPLLDAIPDHTARRIEGKLGVLADGLGAAKRKVCPIIEIERPKSKGYSHGLAGGFQQ